MLKELNSFIENKQEVNYKELLENYSVENTTKQFLEIIKKYN